MVQGSGDNVKLDDLFGEKYDFKHSEAFFYIACDQENDAGGMAYAGFELLWALMEVRCHGDLYNCPDSDVQDVYLPELEKVAGLPSYIIKPILKKMLELGIFEDVEYNWGGMATLVFAGRDEMDKWLH